MPACWGGSSIDWPCPHLSGFRQPPGHPQRTQSDQELVVRPGRLTSVARPLRSAPGSGATTGHGGQHRQRRRRIPPVGHPAPAREGSSALSESLAGVMAWPRRIPTGRAGGRSSSGGIDIGADLGLPAAGGRTLAQGCPDHYLVGALTGSST